MEDCRFCGHPPTSHCKGKVFHAGWKHREPGGFCVGPHCLLPLCCCVELKLEAVPERKQVQSELSAEAKLAISISPFR
jgi:hypothetical protein